MAKEAISVTLETQNLLWLRGQVRASARRSVSEVLDLLVTEARTAGRVERAAVRSVVGTVRLPEADADLETADDAVRRLFPRRRPRPAARGKRSRG